MSNITLDNQDRTKSQVTLDLVSRGHTVKTVKSPQQLYGEMWPALFTAAKIQPQ